MKVFHHKKGALPPDLYELVSALFFRSSDSHVAMLPNPDREEEFEKRITELINSGVLEIAPEETRKEFLAKTK